MGSEELRKKFLDFFKERGHTVVPSSSLIPTDSSVLFTTAGMQQFKPYFLEEKSPYGNKAVSCQKCLRTSDIEKVGDESHLTFFEMLGNFSFAAYFKKEAIKLAYELLNKEYKIPDSKLWITYFEGGKELSEDKESREIWKDLGFPEEKILGFGRDENFWGPTGKEGPCGPTTEIHYDIGGKPCERAEKCLPNCDCGRFTELWNLVFNEYCEDENKNLTPLPKKGVDTGMGLERLAAVLQGKASVFETDIFLPIIEKIEESSSKSYSSSSRLYRIIVDHLKGSVFLISEGILPSNLEQGYVLRRLLRRAIRHGKLLSLPQGFLIPLAQKVIDIYGKIYPATLLRQADILTVIENEEEKFGKTLDKGLKEFERVAEVTGTADLEEIIPGNKAFDLYQSYGFPLELTEELAKEKCLGVDKEGFFEAQRKHQEISRAGKEKKFGGHAAEEAKSEEDKIKITKLHTATHLLHQALREVLGEHVRQMGSDINPERLRFDFSHPQKISIEELKKVEDLVNQKIKENLTVKRKEMGYEKALSCEALAFFKEKYPQKVSVYTIGNWSKEICAGPHVEKTGVLGTFKIKKEEACQAGVRRIKAVLG